MRGLSPERESPENLEGSFVFEFPENPEELTQADYDALDGRYGAIFDEYKAQGKIKDGALQPSCWIDFYKRTRSDGVPQKVLAAYVHNRRGLTLGEQKPDSKVIRPTELRNSSTLHVPHTPPILTQKDRAAGEKPEEDED